ncbi:hypothetical protein GON03_01830 [Nocardioides sp. MAH-18]|uniref:C1q domain-containing protein n=1 Tax=Nocardioides agri TaxID=2682843 RepID=A0A6L6XL45_9ACTN|nr:MULTISPECIES: collagen-like protein [unclassified Nocardioides]MBA2953034.1 collagen-like protein [Nocardioides sp. CGMCC 1.13656]MVQ47904.1 hypothetical protein [Nocardioides sp. MAH-18]
MNTLKQQWVGASIGLLALFVALGGPAAATHAAEKVSRVVITGKQIKDGSIATKDLSKKARAALRGQTGPAGQQGPAGPQGERGVAGPPGPVDGVPAGGDLTGTFPNPQLAAGAVGIAETGVVPAVRITASGTAVPNDTITTVNWASGQQYETVASMYDPAEGTRLVAPVSGLYLAHVSIGFNPNDVGVRAAAIATNGSNSNPACFDRRSAASPALSTFVNATCVVRLNAGEFVTATVTQTSGGTLGFSGFESMSLTWIGRLA